MNGRRMFVWSLLLIAALWGMAAWCWMNMSEVADQAGELSMQVAKCQTTVRELNELKGRPTMAATQSSASSQIQGAIDRQAKAAGIAAESIIDINPMSSVRIGESNYKEQPTSLRLENVSLQQVVKMIHGLATQGKPLTAKVIRIRAPRREETKEIWSVELILTYLIFDASADKK